MKIAVVGCGAVGSYYGAMLRRAGQEVHFLLRSDYDAVRRNGVFVRSPAGDFTVQPHPARTPEEIGVSDLVIIALKTTANEQFATLLPSLVGQRTAVLTLQNGLGNEEQLAKLFPIEQILGGLCFVCLNRLEPGVIHHIAHGLVVIGEFQRKPEPRTHELAALFQRAGVPCKVADNLERAHWEKLVWNIPFNGLGVAGTVGLQNLLQRDAGIRTLKNLGPCLTTDMLLRDESWEQYARELMLEVISVARALNLEIPNEAADFQIERTRSMGAYKASTLLDFEMGRPLELETLFLAPLRVARAAGVPTPRLASLCNILEQLEFRRGQLESAKA